MNLNKKNYHIIDMVVALLQIYGALTIQQIAQILGSNVSLIGDLLLSLFNHTKWLKAYHIQNGLLHKTDIALYKDQFDAFDTKIKWQLTGHKQSVFQALENDDYALYNRLCQLIGEKPITNHADDFVPTYMYSNMEVIEIPKILDTLHQAITESRLLKFTYLDTKMRVVPYHVHYDYDHMVYYLIGLPHFKGQERFDLYRCDKIHDLSMDSELKVRKEYSKEYVLNYLNRQLYHEGDVLNNVQLFVANDGTKAIEETIKRYQDFGIIRYDADDNLIFCGTILSVNRFKRYVRSLGKSARVLAPDVLIQDMLKSYKRKQQLYMEFEEKP